MNFTPCFSKKQMAVFVLVIYALFKDYKRNSLEAMAKSSNIDYQKLQYFISDSKWDMQVIKQKRLEIIQKQRTTASTKDGLIGIDDTGCPKPYAKKTQGAKWQYCGPLKREEICNVAVASAFVSQTKHFPIDIVPYLPAGEFKNSPEFKDKIQIAIELFNNATESLGVSGITFDTWYASTRFLEHIHRKEKVFFSEIKSNRNIFMYHPTKKTHCMVKPGELVTLIKKHYWHKIKYVKHKTKGGNEVSYKTYSFEAKLKDCNVPIKFVVVFGQWNKDDDKKLHILITNQLKASAKNCCKELLTQMGH